MKIYVKYDINVTYRTIMREQLEKLGIAYQEVSLTEVETNKPLTAAERQSLDKALKKYGIEILDDNKTVLVQQMKDAITEMVYSEQRLKGTKFSQHLSKKLHHSYG